MKRLDSKESGRFFILGDWAYLVETLVLFHIVCWWSK